MKIVYSGHAKKRMKERGIGEWEIEQVLTYPSFIIKSFKERRIAVGKPRERLIKVIFIEEERYKKVITVI